ncbi:Klotho [Manis pentadactyla]|nr:Klotho [Manis pentadactyla]
MKVSKPDTDLKQPNIKGWDTPTPTFSAASSERVPSYSVCLHSLPSLSVSLVLVKGAPAQRPTLGHPPLPEGRRVSGVFPT